VKYRKVIVPIDKIEVPPALQKKKEKPKGKPQKK
jgi:hypothetical protein